jgi:V/A-type H+-transporting ATPase subunit F
MKGVVFVTPKDARYGFSLAGVTQLVVEAQEAEATLEKMLADLATGVVVIDERLLEGVGEERLRELERRWYGVLLVLPAPSGEEEREGDYFERLIRRALGYHVRLK